VSQTAVHKVILQFSAPLLARTKQLAEELGTSRSTLIRSAVEEKIERVDRQRLAEQLRIGYLETAERGASGQGDFDVIVWEVVGQEA
jgi:metal-responsive CopG/Arc/MetJ family transcriptional regulator